MLVVPLVIFGAACGLPLDVLGENEDVTQHDENSLSTDPIADDNIADKHPVYDPNQRFTETFSGATFTWNKSLAITELDIQDFQPGDQTLKDRIFTGFGDAKAAIPSYTILPSMELVNAMLKPFNDGLYAAIEIAAETGGGGITMNKRATLDALVQQLVTRASSGSSTERGFANEAAAQIATAEMLGGATATSASSTLAAQFQADSLHARPIGFYTWTPELSQIFQQDRFLQSPESVAPSLGAYVETAIALNSIPQTRDAFSSIVDLYSGLTNPPFDHPVTDLLSLAPNASALGNLQAIGAQFPNAGSLDSCTQGLAFVPASDSPELRLYRALACGNADGDPGEDLLDQLIIAIRSGQIDLTPTATSGFYDRQVYALETLLVPENAVEHDNLFLTKRYKEKLVETFKTILIEDRETHAKQAGEVDEATSYEAPPVDVYPQLPLEPFATFYVRTARAYSFLDAFLRTTLGDAFIDGTPRLLEDGSRAPASIGQELHDKAERLYGMASIAAASIGAPSPLTADEIASVDIATAETNARTWLGAWSTDADVARDPRVVVPVSSDGANTTYWAVVGTKVLHMTAYYYPGHEPTLVESVGAPLGKFVNLDAYLLVGQSLVYQLPADRPPPTRDEFRALCDKGQTLADIQAALTQ
ncbi:MAG: hypothetical protein ABI183_07490 [Polyangiaceae bacterium]